jgi:hypothetical protein
MKILEFIFKLLFQFIEFEDGRFAELKEKAYAWQNKVMAEAETNTKWYHKLLKYDNEWWFQLLLAISFLFAFKSVRAWLMDDPIKAGDDDDDDDEDGEDDIKPKKVNLNTFSKF